MEKNLICKCNTYQRIEQYTEPLGLLAELDEGRPEMEPSELGFLCGLLRKFRPKKLMEVGIAAGGTSVVICDCVQKLGIETELYFVDLGERYYRDETKSSGYLLDECHIGVNYTRLLGQVVASRLEEIGHGIDFLILDTMHIMPGENLDFLACLPYMKEGAIVVLHDTALHLRENFKNAFATSILFQTVTGCKFINNQDSYPNIAAFQVTEDTYRYVSDVFAGLMIPWQYMPEEKQLLAYERKLSQHYPKECIRIFEQAKAQMREVLERHSAPLVELKKAAGLLTIKNVLIYGAGKTGVWTLEYLRTQDIPVQGFIVSDGREKMDSIKGAPVYYFSEIPFKKEDTLIVKAAGAAAVKNALENSGWKWIDIHFQ